MGTALHARRDEGDTHPPVFDIGVFGTVTGKRLASFPLTHVGLETPMQTGKRVMERFSVAARNCRLGHEILGHFLRQESVARVDRAAPVHAVGLVRQMDRNPLRIFLGPAERALGAGDEVAKVVLVTDAYL